MIYVIAPIWLRVFINVYLFDFRKKAPQMEKRMNIQIIQISFFVQ
jgi:hypothetical protein